MLVEAFRMISPEKPLQELLYKTFDKEFRDLIAKVTEHLSHDLKPERARNPDKNLDRTVSSISESISGASATSSQLEMAS